MRRTAFTAAFVVALAGFTPVAAQADPGPTLSHTTAVGVHNAYEQGTFPYFADALSTGAGLLEIDLWTDAFARKWRVSHNLPIGRSYSNCATGLRTGTRDRDFDGCLDNLRDWHAQNPNHPLLVLKVEMKNGFEGRSSMGVPALDALINQKLGGIVYRPGDLLRKPGGGEYADLDEAARADNWPTRDELKGRVIFEIIPGTFEQQNPFDTYWTDVEAADHLRSLKAAGRIGDATVFPTVLGAAGGDPRTRYADAGRRPWFVLFDGGATSYVGGGVDPAWYDANHYLLVMAGAESVAPPIDGRNPTPEQARARVTQLAAAHASLVTSDWSPATGVLGMVTTRG